MNGLTNEEKNRIGDAAIAMMKAFAGWMLAEDRLNVIGKMTTNMLGINPFLSDDIRNVSLKPYRDTFQKSKEDFFNAIGAGFDNKEFWEWCDKQGNNNGSGT